MRATVVVPVAIVFEVYKWLAYEVSIDAARVGLARMRQSFELPPLDRSEVQELAGLLERMPRWAGSLEDALVAMMGLRTDTPVWTLNYRDLAAFPNLRFWTPA
jgi:predicted nucleic acid-binding protein